MPQDRHRNQSGSSRSAGGAAAFLRSGADDRRFEQDAEQAAWAIRHLIDRSIQYAISGLPAELIESKLQEIHAVSVAAPQAWLDPRYVVGEEVLTMIGNRWEAGWQPADLLHYLGRRNPKLDDLGASAVREQLRRTKLDQQLPADWQDQLNAVDPVARKSTGRASWLFGIDPDPLKAWRRVLHLMDRLRKMHPLAPVGPPPSQWPGSQSGKENRHRTPTAGRSARRPDSGLLDRVRALLAKAESTTFAAEAEALTAKAQELIARHSIDETLLHAKDAGRDYQVAARRLHLDNPYAETKALLVQVVGEANQVRAIWDEVAGASTLLGLEVDLEQVELLVTSLLVQATRAMTEAGHGSRSGSVNRSPTFRRSFLSAYATRIGERLAETADQVAAEYGTDLVPLRAEQQQAVDDATEELFPHLGRGGSRTVDLRGWRAGTSAADDAVLPRGRLSAPEG